MAQWPCLTSSRQWGNGTIPQGQEDLTGAMTNSTQTKACGVSCVLTQAAGARHIFAPDVFTKVSVTAPPPIGTSCLPQGLRTLCALPTRPHSSRAEP